MKERRKTHRKPIQYFTYVYDRKTRQLIGYLVDLTLEGGLLVTEKEIPLDTIIFLQIDVPESFEEKNLNITSRVIWCEADPDSDLHKTGVEWMNLDSEGQLVLCNILS
jgi:hypothetical protein